MLRRFFVPALAATLVLGACSSDSPTEPLAEQEDDYALLMFGESGTALEGVFGPQDSDRPFDGRTGRRELPDSIKLTDEQKAEIAALKEAFRLEHAEEIEALKAVFEEARAAKQAGATREEIREILLEGKLIAMELRFDLVDLHEAIWDVFTDAQKRWILAHRPHRFPRPMARP
jgi:hypothetical protein